MCQSIQVSNIDDLCLELYSLSHWVYWVDKQKDPVYCGSSNAGSFQLSSLSQIEIYFVVNLGIQF